MLGRVHFGKCFKKYFTQQKYIKFQNLQICRTIHETLVLSHASVIDASTTERASINHKPMRNVRDGPSLKDFLGSSIIDLSNEKSVPYIPDISGENQKGFSDTFYQSFISRFFMLYVIIQKA